MFSFLFDGREAPVDGGANGFERAAAHKRMGFTEEKGYPSTVIQYHGTGIKILVKGIVMWLSGNITEMFRSWKADKSMCKGHVVGEQVGNPLPQAGAITAADEHPGI